MVVSLVKATAHTVTPEDVTVTRDHMGREVIVIPDALARAMTAEIQRDWTEIPGVADGHSRKFREGHWMYAVTQTILATYAASPLPTDVDSRDLADATTARQWAGSEFPFAYAFIVGQSGWDASTRWWADDNYAAHRDLHVTSPFPHTGNDWWEFLDAPEDVANKTRYVEYAG